METPEDKIETKTPEDEIKTKTPEDKIKTKTPEIKTKTPEDIFQKDEKFEIDEKKEEDLVYRKESHNWIYKLLKLNPIDPINDYIHTIIEKMDLTEKSFDFQWHVAMIWCKFAIRIFWNYKAEGPLPPEYGAAIIVSNHQSHLDPFFVGAAVHRPIRWMSKVENFKTPIVRTLFTNLGAFELDRDNSAAGWAQAKEYLETGHYVGIFPEGTRAVEDELGEFRTGAVRLAIEMGVPIVPMAVIGSKDSLPKGKLVMKRVKVKCRVGNPIYYDEYYGKGEVPYTEVRKLTDELRQIITDLRDEKDKEEKDLSIGYPEDREDKPSSFNPMKLLKRVGFEIVKLIDNAWHSLLLNLEIIGAADVFKKACYGITGAILDVWTPLMNPIKMIDFEKYIPAEGGALISCGHNSEWDVLMVVYAIWLKNNRRHAYEMAKESLFKIPLVNAWARSHFAFPLRRGAHDVNSYNQAKAYLERGELVVVYPEGTTNTGGGELLEGHTGAVRLAIDAKVPIIPIGVTGTEDIYPKHGKMINFGKSCIFKAGEPFMEHAKYYDKPMPDYDELKRITANMMAKIKDLMFYNDPDI